LRIEDLVVASLETQYLTNSQLYKTGSRMKRLPFHSTAKYYVLKGLD